MHIDFTLVHFNGEKNHLNVYFQRIWLKEHEKQNPE